MDTFSAYFARYPKNIAPFMHKQFAEWKKLKPLAGLRVMHHVPLVLNTMLKIACVKAAGAQIVVSNPHFAEAHADALLALRKENIPYVEDLSQVKGQSFDLFFDCGGDLYQHLGRPRLGSIELTESGDMFYRNTKLDFPVVSIDRTYTKQIETLFGSSMSVHRAIVQLTGIDVAKKSWMVFGFGKIGRGISYYCYKNQTPLIVADIDKNARAQAKALGIQIIDPNDLDALQAALEKTDILVTATGKKAVLSIYPKEWFAGKILANMGILDEFGDQFRASEVLNHKQPVNFILEDPTPMEFIDPEFFAHNIAALQLLNNELSPGVFDLSPQMDLDIIREWCQYHHHSIEVIKKWLIAFDL